MGTQTGPAFSPLRLHRRTEAGWAVIRRATGAIALDDRNRLMMRLSEQEAARMAADLSERDAVKSRDET